MDHICYIVGAAPLGETVPAPVPGDLLIAADAGFASLQALGLTPDRVMGDFDSLGYAPDHPDVETYSPIKDDTDLMLAVRWALKQGWRRFHIYGALGGKRLDMTLASLQTLRFLSDHKAEGLLIGDGWNVTLLQNGTLRFPGEAQGWVSVFCSGDEAKGVTLRGLKYEAENAALTCAFPLGVSNEFLGREALVQVTDGSIFVLWQGDAMPEVAHG